MLSPHLVPSLMSPGLTSSSPTSEVTELQQMRNTYLVYIYNIIFTFNVQNQIQLAASRMPVDMLYMYNVHVLIDVS